MKIKFGLITILTAFISLLGFGSNVFADEPVLSAMTISPMYQKVILVPGETTTMSLKISSPNSAKNDLQYSVSVGSFSHNGSSPDNDSVDTETVTSYNQIMDWITLGKTTGTVAPNTTDVLNFTITVPESAPAGGQYATILIKDDTSSNSGASNVNIQSNVQTASIIYAEVAGETINTADIVENTIPSFLTTNELETTSLVKNTGNVHTDAKYTLQVWPMFSDEEICTNEEDASTNLIMPQMERYYIQRCTLPAVGIFKVKQVVKIFDEVSTVEKTIIVCPIWLMIMILVIIVAIITAIVVVIKKNKSKKSNS